MRRDDARYGAHSAIQKAVRRGSLDLAKTAFDLMWPEKEHRSWLKWRMTSIVQEDSLGMLGELPDFYKRVKGLGLEQEEKEWRRMVYRVTLAPANKDASGLAHLATRTSADADEHLELAKTREWFQKMAEAGGSPSAVADDMFDALTSERDFSDYEIAAMRLLRWRAGAGGMLDDRHMALAGMILVAERGVDGEASRRALVSGVAAWKKQFGRTSPETVPLPWYSFDMHTQVGKIALSSLARRKEVDQELLRSVWFLAESALIPNWHCQWSRVIDKPTIFDSMWWPLALRNGLRGNEAKKNLRWWRDEMSSDVKGFVEWLLEKRSVEEEK